MIEKQINEKEFDFISPRDKGFIVDFTQALEEMGYTYGDTIGSGFCWGKYMLIFRKASVKSKNVVARIYIRDNSIVLRLFLNNVSKHSEYLSTTPHYIKNVFVRDHGKCTHCRDNCRFRKEYEVDGLKYEKCSGVTFEFYDPTDEKLNDFLNLFREFYPKKRA